MKCKGVLAVAVVAMFAFTSFSMIASDTSAESTEGSYTYIKFTDITKDKFELVFNPDDYAEFLQTDQLLDNIFNPLAMTKSNVTTSYAYDSISVECSKTEELTGTKYTSGEAERISVKNLKITMHFNNDPTVCIYANTSMYSDFSDVVSYLGEKPIVKDSEIIMTCPDYKVTMSKTENKQYSLVFGDTKYIVSDQSGQSSSSNSYAVNTAIGNKSMIISSDMRTIYDSKTTYNFLNSEYKEGSTYTATTDIDYEMTGGNVLSANGKQHTASTDGLLSIFGQALDGITTVGTISSSQYSDLPFIGLKYSETFAKLSDNNKYAEAQIHNAGGTCDQTKESAQNLIKDVYGGQTNDNKNNDGLMKTILIVAAIITVIVVAIIIVVVVWSVRRR